MTILDYTFQNSYIAIMARPKEFDREEALEAAIDVFGMHGFAGTSAEMLKDAMKIGRQSLYDTFGDKWQLYCSAVEHYGTAETQAHLEALRSGSAAIDGIHRLIERVVAKAHKPCLGVNSISEFGNAVQELAKIRETAGGTLRAALIAKLRQARTEGDIAADLDPKHAAGFLLASVASIRLAARSGASDADLRMIGRLALRALR